jgi:hypothetical protein
MKKINLDFDIVKNSNDGMIGFHKSKKSKLKSFSEKNYFRKSRLNSALKKSQQSNFKYIFCFFQKSLNLRKSSNFEIF